jgi:hypothetical protein
VWKLIILLSLLPLVAAWLGRQWFWTKVRLEGMRRDCETSVTELRQRLGLKPARRGTETHAAALGNAVRECGLELLEKEGDMIAKARISGGYLTRVLPALCGIVLVFSILSFRIQFTRILAMMCAIVAVWTVTRLLGMAVEWRAVAKGTEALKNTRALKRMDDEAEVIRCAKASVWSTVWPF